MTTLQSIGLTPDAVRKYVVSVKPGVGCDVFYFKTRQKRLDAGLTARGDIAKENIKRKHPDIAGLPLKERRRITAQRWRAERKAMGAQ